MAHTAHHYPPSQTRKTYDGLPGSPWHCVVVRDLRYSRRSLTEAVKESRRPPRPSAVRREVRVYCFPRHNRDGGVARWSAQEERRARQRLRTQVGRLRGLMNADADAGGGIGVVAAETVEIPPANHRHGSLWLA